MKKKKIYPILRMIKSFQKTAGRGPAILEESTGIGRSEMLFEVLENRWNNWYFYKVMCNTLEYHADFLLELPCQDRIQVTKQVFTRLEKIWNGKHPILPMSLKFYLDIHNENRCNNTNGREQPGDRAPFFGNSSPGSFVSEEFKK